MATEAEVDAIKLHKETIANDSNSPLHLIREKELEISGRMLAAKRQSDEIVTEARKKAAELVSAAEAEGGMGAKDHAGSIISDADGKAAALRTEAKKEAAAIAELAKSRRDSAVALVVEAVTTV
jgi:vacuolar-type H+-ATPase subunit H